MQALLLLVISSTGHPQQTHSAYTLRLRNNSDADVTVRLRQVPVGENCDTGADGRTVAIRSRGNIDLRCDAAAKTTYCLDGYSPLPLHDERLHPLQLICSAHVEQVLEVNLFGR